jgi:hypothetical protein
MERSNSRFLFFVQRVGTILRYLNCDFRPKVFLLSNTGSGPSLALFPPLPYKPRLQAAAVAGGPFQGSMPDVRRLGEPWFETAPAGSNSVVKTGS